MLQWLCIPIWLPWGHIRMLYRKKTDLANTLILAAIWWFIWEFTILLFCSYIFSYPQLLVTSNLQLNHYIVWTEWQWGWKHKVIAEFLYTMYLIKFIKYLLSNYWLTIYFQCPCYASTDGTCRLCSTNRKPGMVSTNFTYMHTSMPMKLLSTCKIRFILRT